MSHALLHAGHYAVVIGLCLAAVRPLAASRWTWRAPRTAILLWQALAVSLAASLVGLFLTVGLSRYRNGELYALARWVFGASGSGLTAAQLAAVAVGLTAAVGLAGSVVWQLASAARARRRHRSRLALVAEPDPADRRLLRVDHPAPLAYCLPGRGRTVVVSTGTVELLDHDQLAAVLDHERAHLRERHDLVLLPFAALRRVLRHSRLATRAYAAVALLVEMRADDLALRRHPPERLAAALRAIGDAPQPPVPDGAMGVADPRVRARLERLARPDRMHPAAITAALTVAAATAATPISLYLFPGP